MKNLILILLVHIFATNVHAGISEAKPLKDLIQTVQQTEFKYVETAKSFGYDTTKSCLYASADILVLKNYCFPKKEYPAKSYTIISPKFGIVELYQENFSDTLQKRDVLYSVFSADLRAHLVGDVSQLKIADTNKLFELFNRTQPGACWSTNYSYYTEEPDVNCSHGGADVIGFDSWAKETQDLTADQAQWKELIYNLGEKFKD
jgi:hypothetical protein